VAAVGLLRSKEHRQDTEAVLHHKPKRRRSIGFPKKTWIEQIYPEVSGTGTKPKPSEFMIMMMILTVQ
jgi:hypothetical protein